MIRPGSSEPHRVCVDISDAEYRALLVIADSAFAPPHFTIDDFCRAAISRHIAAHQQHEMQRGTGA